MRIGLVASMPIASYHCVPIEAPHAAHNRNLRVLPSQRSQSDRIANSLPLRASAGGELFALIEEMGALPEPAVMYYTAAVALALGHLHSKGFLYRDLKPENLLLDVDGHLKLCDLGLAKRAERAYTVVGTPQYLAPEVLRGEGATAASDWWALGILVFEMLTGQLPFNAQDGSDRSLFTAIKLGVYTWPREVRRTGKQGRTLPPSARVHEFVAQLLRQALSEETSSPDCVSNAVEPHRLGSGDGDVAEVCGHPWLQSFDFQLLLNGEYPPPFVPKLAGADDDANFGPIDWRGEPVLHTPDYDAAKWDTVWKDW